MNKKSIPAAIMVNGGGKGDNPPIGLGLVTIAEFFNMTPTSSVRFIDTQPEWARRIDRGLPSRYIFGTLSAGKCQGRQD